MVDMTAAVLCAGVVSRCPPVDVVEGRAADGSAGSHGMNECALLGKPGDGAKLCAAREKPRGGRGGVRLGGGGGRAGPDKTGEARGKAGQVGVLMRTSHLLRQEVRHQTDPTGRHGDKERRARQGDSTGFRARQNQAHPNNGLRRRPGKPRSSLRPCSTTRPPRRPDPLKLDVGSGTPTTTIPPLRPDTRLLQGDHSPVPLPVQLACARLSAPPSAISRPVTCAKGHDGARSAASPPLRPPLSYGRPPALIMTPADEQEGGWRGGRRRRGTAPPLPHVPSLTLTAR